MRAFITLTIVLLVTVAPVMAQNVADEAAIKKANEERIAIWNAKDEKAYSAFFDEGCTNGYSGGACAVRAFPEEWKNSQLRIEEANVVFITSDIAILRYTQEGSGFVDADGKPQPPGKNRRVSVYKKKSGKWLLAVHGLMQPIEE